MFVHLRRSNTMMHCIRKPSEPAFCGGFCVLTQGTLRRRRMDSGGAFLRFFTVERSESYQNIFVHCPSADADHAGIPV
mgnify:CR=1 FL=1